MVPFPRRGRALDPMASMASIALAAGAGALFWWPARAAARGFFPAPLDDVYIHFEFARSLAAGHPFEWIPGQGYSSGETSPLYALVLAVGWLLGFRGPSVGIWAAIVAIVSMAWLVRSVRALAAPLPWWVSWAAAALPLSVALVDWTLFSGMEVALHAGLLGAAFVALDRLAKHDRRATSTRASREWGLGAWVLALVLVRPESVVVGAVVAITAGRGAGARSAVASIGRVTAPAAVALLALAAANRLATGDVASAGAELKLLSSNPFLSDVDRARTLVENLVTFALKGVRVEIALPLTALAGVAALFGERPAAARAAIVSAIGWTLLVSWNGNAPYHNFRYYAPAILMVTIAASIGVATIARGHLRLGLAARGVAFAARGVAFAAAAAAVGLGAQRFPAQVEYFGRAVANVRDQQIEVGARLARTTPPDARVLVGDAGAIPFVSGRAAIDALGLGGFHRMPFARAAVNGEPAVVELIERLAPAERPTYLALYPNWFSALTGRFGVELDHVTIQHNIICGGPTKGIYRADWSALGSAPSAADAGADADEIDVADVVSEEAHGYAPPIPRGGWTTLDVLTDASGARRFDGGRIIPEGERESFVVLRAPGRGHARARLRVRVDDAAIAIRALAGGQARDLTLSPPRPGAWREAVGELDLAPGDTVTLEAARGAYRDYHVWIEPRQPSARP